MNQYIQIKSGMFYSMLVFMVLIFGIKHSYASTTDIAENDIHIKNNIQNNIQIVRYNQSSLSPKKIKYDYYPAILKLALDESVEEFGPYKMVPVSINAPQQRLIKMLEQEEFVDVLWTSTSKQREQILQAVYIPLLKGVMGCRILLIREGDQDKFSKINSLDELKALATGQGIDWPDTEILIANGFNVVQAIRVLLYKMLIKERFDYFPRSCTEVWSEDDMHPELIAEPTIMLQYTSPLYFFVNNKNTHLAMRLEVGLLKAINNGKFDKLFFELKIPDHILKKINRHERKVFKLDSPSISEKTKALKKNTELWLF